MRDVAVTEGDKVEAQIRLGFASMAMAWATWSVRSNEASEAEVDQLVEEYFDEYDVGPGLAAGGEKHASLRERGAHRAGLRSFLKAGNFTAFTTTFEDLHGLAQLPGLAVQRLMADGYGFGAEGDWKTSALVRAMKVMSAGLVGRHQLHGRLHLSLQRLRR